MAAACVNGGSFWLILAGFLAATMAATAAQTWCISRSDVNEHTLQAALDYACGEGADCVPLQPSGLCFLPNTRQAHASYAFNSYYQRKGQAPSSCNFSGAAVVAITDPSYGSCIYPASASSAGGGIVGNGTPTAVSAGGGGGAGGVITGGSGDGFGSGGNGTGGLTPFSSSVPDTETSGASSSRSSSHLFATVLLIMLRLLWLRFN